MSGRWQRKENVMAWISVKKRLPPEHERVLIWWHDNDPSGPKYYARFGEINCGHWRPDGGNGNFDDRVSHWQPVPEAPNGLS